MKGHHVCWFLHYGEWPTNQLDHDNRNRTDNRICNLIESNSRAQSVNRPSSDNRGLPTGVYFEGNRYVAKATINYKTTYLGRFKTPEEASNAYQLAISKAG